jgi:serine/threonine protein kinase/formylglycine-generating enzyme required for sulfatase activity
MFGAMGPGIICVLAPDPTNSGKSTGSQVTVDFLRNRIRHDRDAGDLRPLNDYLAVFSADESMVAQAYFAVCQESTPPASGEATVLHRTARTSMLSATRGGPATPVAAGSPADHVGPYRLIKELGRGGQGAVHLAEDTRLGRRVALKVLTGVGSLTDANLRRFHREAELASKLDHPGICAVYDFGAFEGVPYIAMRFVEGETLAKRIATAKAPEVKPGASEHIAIDDAPVPVSDTDTLADTVTTTTRVETNDIIRVMEKAARAIHAAHEAGVIHRDLKPGNIMVDASGEPVVLDFGLARDLEGDGVSLTRSGDFLGTPAYMSPEQIASGHIHLDRRSDVYSLGVTLYECLTLRRPFDAPTREALYQAILSKEPPDPRRFNKSVSTDLKVVLDTALNKDRDKRYVTAEAFANDLRRVIEMKPISAKPVSPLGRVIRWARRNPGVASATAIAFLSLAIGLVATLIQKERADRHRDAAEASAKEATANLLDWTRLADGRRLEDLVNEANGPLWPATPEKVPLMEAWLARARDLGSRLGEHEAALAALQARAKPYDPAARGKEGAATASGPESRAAEGRTWEFGTPEDQLKHDKLLALVRDLEAFLGPKRDDLATVGEMTGRLEYARTVRKQTVDDYAAVWRDTIAAIAKSPLYGGLRIKEQVGLIPLGPDPKSGLYEFTEAQTGTPARRGEGGRIEILEDSAMVFVLLPGGTFFMGAQNEDKEGHNYDPGARQIELPVDDVTLSPFFVSKFEMTQGQWLRFTGKNPSQYGPGKKLGDKAVDLTHPVELVTWTQCDQILQRLGMQLPTEAQWEYAARAGTETPWWCGADPACLQAAANLADQSFRTRSLGLASNWTYETWDDGFAGIAPVGQLEANRFGLHDVLGNVWEWCRDAFAKDAYATSPCQPGDGVRVPAGATIRVIRGAAFTHRADNARSAYRASNAENVANPAIGVRASRAIQQ